MRKSVSRKRLTLTEMQWEHLERVSKTRPASGLLAEFWRIALGYTMTEWNTLPPKSFRVWDYELSLEDRDRLYGIVVETRSRSIRGETALAWLNIGPAEPDPPPVGVG